MASLPHCRCQPNSFSSTGTRNEGILQLITNTPKELVLIQWMHGGSGTIIDRCLFINNKLPHHFDMATKMTGKLRQPQLDAFVGRFKHGHVPVSDSHDDQDEILGEGFASLLFSMCSLSSAGPEKHRSSWKPHGNGTSRIDVCRSDGQNDRQNLENLCSHHASLVSVVVEFWDELLNCWVGVCQDMLEVQDLLQARRFL